MEEERLTLHLLPHSVLLGEVVGGEELSHARPVDGVEGDGRQDPQLVALRESPSHARDELRAVPTPAVYAIRGVVLDHGFPHEAAPLVEDEHRAVEHLRLAVRAAELGADAVAQAAHVAHHNHVGVQVNASIFVQRAEAYDLRDRLYLRTRAFSRSAAARA